MRVRLYVTRTRKDRESGVSVHLPIVVNLFSENPNAVGGLGTCALTHSSLPLAFKAEQRYGRGGSLIVAQNIQHHKVHIGGTALERGPRNQVNTL